jgi:hypothetical protein
MSTERLAPPDTPLHSMSLPEKQVCGESTTDNDKASSALATSTQNSPTPPLTPPRDLWRDAFDKLPKGTQQEIKIDQKSQREHIHELLEVARAKQKECENKFWQFRVGDHEIVIRDYAVRIVDCLQKVGDIAIQFAPPQASVPWSMVKMVLQVCYLLCC